MLVFFWFFFHNFFLLFLSFLLSIAIYRLQVTTFLTLACDGSAKKDCDVQASFFALISRYLEVYVIDSEDYDSEFNSGKMIKNVTAKQTGDRCMVQH
jgi:hypothetical protein